MLKGNFHSNIDKERRYPTRKMDVRTRAQERNQDLEHGLHVKLSDDELVRQFTGKSLRS